MKPAALTGTLLLLIGSTASAQLTLLPQAGFEQTQTSLQYNGLSRITPLSPQGDLKAALRADYRFKGGHGPFIGVGSSPATVAFRFTDPGNALSTFKASANSLQWQLSGGYQYSTKPIQLTKGKTKSVASSATTKTVYKSGCGSRTYSRCTPQNKTTTAQKKGGLNLSLQPYAGVAYRPDVQPDFEMANTAYQYNAGNWKTAFISGMGFELGSGRQRLITLTAHYAKGISNLQTKPFTTEQNGKAVATRFSSSTSSWGLTLGVPISLTKSRNTAVAKPAATQKAEPKKCGEYRSRCARFS